MVGFSFISAAILTNKGLGGTITTLRTSFLLIGYYLGSNGMFIGGTILIMYMISLRSIGVAYLSPFIPFNEWVTLSWTISLRESRIIDNK